MKSLFKFLCYGFMICMVLGSLAVAGLSIWGMQEYKKAGPLAEAVEVDITRGASLGAIADLLKHKNVIQSYDVFKIMAYVTGRASKLQAGSYEFSPQASMKEVLEKLESGQIVTRKITIPEGLTNFEIDRLLMQNSDIKQTKIHMRSEGRYLPETYSFASGDSNIDIMNQMSAALDKALDEEWKNREDGLPFETKEQALVLASIIEKETAVNSERKTVAGVFVNRLRRGIALQTDPTVIYALTGGAHENDGKGPLGRRLLKKDLQFDSPYNTYKYPGLPPGPIANAGRASINAALHPEKHDYIFFVADGTGGHVFGKTLAEHNSNVAKWRKIRKASGK